MKFKKGDNVMLRSGGPTMTVTETELIDENEVICEWFNKVHDHKEKNFQQHIELYHVRFLL